jgi:hypothetical protein
MWKRLGATAAALLAVGLTAGCRMEVTAPESWRETGVLLLSGWSGATQTALRFGAEDVVWGQPPGEQDYSAPHVLVAPDTVQAGVPFSVTTHTVGPSGCWRADGQTVGVYARVVVLKPYDRHSGSEFCTGALVFPVHESTLTLTEPGEWTIRVDGRHLRLGQDVKQVPISAEKTIVVL